VRELFSRSPERLEGLGDLARQAEDAWLERASGSNLLFGEAYGRKLVSLKAELTGPTTALAAADFALAGQPMNHRNSWVVASVRLSQNAWTVLSTFAASLRDPRQRIHSEHDRAVGMSLRPAGTAGQPVMLLPGMTAASSFLWGRCWEA
jgi:hypothetical protein